MAEERKLPRVGGSRTLNADGTEVKATPKPESETKPSATFTRTVKKKTKE